MSDHSIAEINFWETRTRLELQYHEARMNRLADHDEKDKRIAALEAERDDYKDRWEQTGCTRHGAMEAAIKVNKELLEQIVALEIDAALELGDE